MTLTPEQVVAANKANLETLVGLTTKAFSGIEELIELNLAAAKSAMTDSQEHIHASLSVKDVQELLALQSSLFQPLAEKAVAYNRHLYEIATATEAQNAFHSMVDNAAKNAPAGSEAAVAAFKTAVAAGSNALETVQKAVKQATEVAETNYKTLAANALSATGAAAAATARKPAAKKR